MGRSTLLTRWFWLLGLGARHWLISRISAVQRCAQNRLLLNRKSLLTDLNQAWVYAHMQLTPEEAAPYKNAPVIYNGDLGFFFEPNE